MRHESYSLAETVSPWKNISLGYLECDLKDYSYEETHTPTHPPTPTHTHTPSVAPKTHVQKMPTYHIFKHVEVVSGSEKITYHLP